MKKRIISFFICIILIFTGPLAGSMAYAKGPDYTALEDVYYAVEGCKVYAEPTYTAIVLTEIAANVPVRVVGFYSNGWYKINIGLIAYCKMDSLTSAGVIGVPNASDTQALAAKQIADSLGYEFVNMKLNKEKIIKKDIFNSYVGRKVILFAKIDDDVAVMFKMIYPYTVTKDINLNYTKTISAGNGNSRIIDLTAADLIPLYDQIAIFQFRVGYDKCVDNYVCSIEDGTVNLMNSYYTEFEEFSYAPVTQIGHLKIVECEVPYSLTDSVRQKMNDLKSGIKYMSYDEKDYRNSITSKLRKDTEYIDYR